jgi:branched-chain amino acid transport system substrate-binding protein
MKNRFLPATEWSALRNLVCFWAGLCLAGCNQPSSPDPISIGHLASFSSAGKIASEHAKQGIELALADLNKSIGPIAGRPLRVLHVDTRDDPELLVPEAVRVITVNRAMAIIGGNRVSEVHRLARALEPYEVALLTPTMVPADSTEPNVFSLVPSTTVYGTVLARFIAKELKSSSVLAVVDNRETATASVVESCLSELKKETGIKAETWPYKGVDSLTGLPEKLEKFKPDALLYAGTSQDLEPIWKCFGERSPRPSLLLADADMAHHALEFAKTDTVFWSSVLSAEDHSDVAKRYTEVFQEKPGAMALLAYDAVSVAAEALHRSKNITGARVLGELQKSQAAFQCSTGNLSFDVGQRAMRSLFVIQAREGKIKTAKSYEPNSF